MVQYRDRDAAEEAKIQVDFCWVGQHYITSVSIHFGTIQTNGHHKRIFLHVVVQHAQCRRATSDQYICRYLALAPDITVILCQGR